MAELLDLGPSRPRPATLLFDRESAAYAYFALGYLLTGRARPSLTWARPPADAGGVWGNAVDAVVFPSTQDGSIWTNRSATTSSWQPCDHFDLRQDPGHARGVDPHCTVRLALVWSVAICGL